MTPFGTSAKVDAPRRYIGKRAYVKGEGEMTVDNETAKVKPGDVCLTKSGSKHALKNTGDSEMTIIVIEADLVK